MKKLRFSFLLLLALLSLAAAASAAPKFTYDSMRLDFSAGRCIFDGNVRIADNGRTVSADHAEVDLKTALKFLKNGVFDTSTNQEVTDFEVWCEGSIVVEQQGLKLTSDKAHVIGESHDVAVEGNVLLERPGLSIRASSGIFNWDTQIAQFDDNVKIKKNGTEIRADHTFYDVGKDELL